jgi:hypothetical protein
MDDDTPEVDNADSVGTLQAGAAAGGEPTSGNDENPETQVEDPTETDELDDDPDDDDGGSSESDETDELDETDTAPVARARRQAARYRRELRDVEAERDELAAALWTERVAALGVLADPTDLPPDPDALHDPDRLRELADELVARKPHLRSRRIRERAGQGEGDGSGTVSLSGLLRRNA